MSKTSVLIYYDLNGGDDETVETVKEKAAFVRGRVGNRSVMLRDAIHFDGVEPRVAIAVLLGGTSSAALASVYEAYEAVGVPLSSYGEFIGGDGPELTEDEEPESGASYLGRLKAAATERGLNFGDGTTADDLEAMIKSHDDAKHQKMIDEAAEFGELSKEAIELGVEFSDEVTNEQLRVDIAAARAAKQEADDFLKERRAVAEGLGIVTDDEMTVEQVDDLIADKQSEEGTGEAPAFDVEAADFDALKAKADELEITYPSNIGEATLRKKIADHLTETE